MMSLRNSIKNLAPVMFAVMVASACDDSDTNGDVQSVAPPPIPQSDVDYIDALVPHHQQALEMADVELARGVEPEVRDMAQMMRTMQQQEIADLLAIRADLSPGFQQRVLTDPHATEDMAEMSNAAGSAVDVMFLENMIPHHAGAVSLSHRALGNLTVPELQEIARTTIRMQTREMNEMLDMLEQ